MNPDRWAAAALLAPSAVVTLWLLAECVDVRLRRKERAALAAAERRAREARGRAAKWGKAGDDQ